MGGGGGDGGKRKRKWARAPAAKNTPKKNLTKINKKK
jgi:hypothetical protein